MYVRGQLSPFLEFWGLNSSCHVSTLSILTLWVLIFQAFYSTLLERKVQLQVDELTMGLPLPLLYLPPLSLPLPPRIVNKSYLDLEEYKYFFKMYSKSKNWPHPVNNHWMPSNVHLMFLSPVLFCARDLFGCLEFISWPLPAFLYSTHNVFPPLEMSNFPLCSWLA